MKKHRVLLFGASLLFLGAGASQALSLGEIETRVRQQIRDTSTNASLQRYSDTILDAQINDVQRDVVNQTWVLDNIVTLSLSVNTTYYTLPDDYNAAQFARYIDPSNNTYVLEEKNERSFRQSNPDWQKQTGKPVQYFVRTSTSSGATFEMGIYPIPSTTTQLGSIVVDYYSQPTDLSNDSDQPFDGLTGMIPFHEVLTYCTTYRIKLMEGKTDEAAAYSTLCTGMINTINSKFQSRPNWLPSTSGATK